MASFSASYDESSKKINVTCDTYWSCKCDGMIMLSKYSGIGNDVIDVINMEEVKMHYGRVYFTYGDERCDYPVLSVSYINYDVTIGTIPQWLKCKNDKGKEFKVLYFNYHYPTDTFKFTVNRNSDDWEIKNNGSGHIYFINGNDITVVANNENDFVIGATNSNDTTKHIYIKLIKI